MKTHQPARSTTGRAIRTFLAPGSRLGTVLLFASCLTPLTRAAAATETAEILPRHALAMRYYGNDAPWYERNIPFFDCSDADLTRVYYYRWQLYKSHLKDLGERGYIVTEFLNDVSWAFNPYQSLDDATAFHISEGRWLRDARYLDDYITFMYSGANDRHFSDAIAAATYGRFLVNADRAFAISNLGGMKRLYGQWSDHLDASKGLYHIPPIADATEYSIASIDASGGKDGFFGGDAFRPTINSFMFGNARAISRLSALAGDAAGAEAYAAKAAALKAKVQTDLWSEPLQHFIDRYTEHNQFVHYWDFIRGRELAGFVPWAFSLPDDNSRYAVSWRRLLSPQGFAGRFGLRTVEPSYEFYMRQYRYDQANGVKRPECQWNGPTWPFDNTLVLQAMANLLNDYAQNVVTVDDYMRLLKQYARQHFLNGEPDLQEDYNPDTGAVIVGLPRSHHYNHSAFNDLVIGGLAGLRPREDDALDINPLIPGSPDAPDSIAYFCLEDVPYHGHSVTVIYDRTGAHYGRGAGLQAYVDGRQVLKPSPLGRRTIPVPAPSVHPVARPIDLAGNFTKKGFPAASASVNNAVDEVYQAIDGRVWFFLNVRNYWTDAGSTAAEDWFSIDFGRERNISRVCLYFYGDGKAFRAPAGVRLQRWSGADWVDIEDTALSPQELVANGENTVAFPSLPTSKLRLVFLNPRPAAVALVEAKVFE